jgi:hypothetical protein
MKKVLSFIAVGIVAASSAFAQGTVNFAGGTTKVSVAASVGGTASLIAGNTTATPNYYFALFYSTSSPTVNGSSSPFSGTQASGSYVFETTGQGWTFSQDYGTNTTANGKFSSSVADVNGITTVSGLAGGGASYFTVVGWSSNIGSTVAALQSFVDGNSSITGTGYVGESAVSGLITTGAGLGTPGALFGSAPAIPGWTLTPVSPAPEPASIALAALGGLSLLGLRRKKA